MRRVRKIPFGSDNFLSILEGVEGGFAIFAGIIIGLMIEGVSRDLLILTAVISIVVSAFNSSAVRYTSEHYIDELDGHEKRDKLRSYLIPSAVEFVSYLFVSLIALLPLIFVRPLELGIGICIVLTIIILFVAGYYRGYMLNRRHALRDGGEVAGLGLLIVCVGAIAGIVTSYLIKL